MRRLFRILIRSLTVLSLLLCVTTCVLWVRSYRNVRANDQDHYCAYVSELSFDVRSDGGEIVIGVVPARDYTGAFQGGWSWSRFGFYISVSGSGDFVARQMIVPYWSVASFLAILSATFLIRRRRRTAPGACRRCVYDLRATPDRCPECGAVPAGKAIA